MIAHLARHRRKRLQVGEEIADVFDPSVLVGRVGKGRKKMHAGRRGALRHRGDEFGFGPVADAVGAVRRDVGRIERAERRGYRKTAAELQPIARTFRAEMDRIGASEVTAGVLGRVRANFSQAWSPACLSRP